MIAGNSVTSPVLRQAREVSMLREELAAERRSHTETCKRFHRNDARRIRECEHLREEIVRLRDAIAHAHADNEALRADCESLHRQLTDYEIQAKRIIQNDRQYVHDRLRSILASRGLTDSQLCSMAVCGGTERLWHAVETGEGIPPA